jgi:hypothetical protein
MPTKTQHFLSILIIILTFMMTACQGDPTPITPEGDPREAAHEFMTALYEGDTDRCRALSSREVRDAAEKLCQDIDDRSAVASINLSETTFEVTLQQTAVVTISMSGRWTILNVGSDGEAKEETHDSDTEGPIILFMIYEEDHWRFHGFDE